MAGMQVTGKDLNGAPFIVMQQKFAIKILFHLKDQPKSYLNELIRVTGGEFETVVKAVQLLESFHYVKRTDRGADHHPRWEFELTSRGRKVGDILSDAAKQLLQVPP